MKPPLPFSAPQVGPVIKRTLLDDIENGPATFDAMNGFAARLVVGALPLAVPSYLAAYAWISLVPSLLEGASTVASAMLRFSTGDQAAEVTSPTCLPPA